MRQGNVYTFVFVLAVSAVCALVLSTASQALKGFQAKNAEVDKKNNILTSSGFEKKGRLFCFKDECLTTIECYDKYISAIAVNYEGKVTESTVPPVEIDLDHELDRPVEKRHYPIFIKREQGEITGFIIPVSGMGLWSKINGYLALESDLNTVKGISFYKHGETPGLGAEISNDDFKKSFIGKRVLDDNGTLVSVEVVKGRADSSSPRYDHKVDGISGATLTGRGVTELLKKSLLLYEPYFQTIRKGGAAIDSE